MKKLILITFILISYLGYSQQLEPKTAVLNGLILNGKTTAAIQALTVAPNGYQQYSTDTETIWLKTPGGWVDTNETIASSNVEAVTQAEYDALSQPQKDAFTGIIVDAGTGGGTGTYTTTFNNQTGTTYTLQATDAINNTKVRLSNAAEITVSPPVSPTTGETFWVEKVSTGNVVFDFPVIKGDSLTDARIIGRGSSVVLAYDGTNYQITGDYEAYEGTLTLPNFGVGTELVSVGAYGFPPNEANSINYLVGYPPIDATVTSEADATNGYGDFVAQIVATDIDNSRVRHRLEGLTAGQTLRWYFLSKMTVGTNGRINSTVNITGGPNIQDIANTDWELRTGTCTVTANGDVQFDIHATDFAGGSVGDTMQYKFSVKVE